MPEEKLLNCRKALIRPQSTTTVRAPLRIPLGGGGTDLPSYWKGRGGFFISGAINKYVTVSLAPPFGETNGEVDDFVTEVVYRVTGQPRRISWASDISPGSGLGFSSALVVAILYAFEREKGVEIHKDYIAQRAYHIERELRPVGFQDHYAAAFGGVIACEIAPTGGVTVTQLLRHGFMSQWLEWFRLYDTGLRRQAAELLNLQDKKATEGDTTVLGCLKEIEAIGRESLVALLNDDQELYGALTARHWLAKKTMSPKVTNARIDKLCSEVPWACGYKLIGAGGGGCLLLVSSPGHIATHRGMRRIPFMWSRGVHSLLPRIHGDRA